MTSFRGRGASRVAAGSRQRVIAIRSGGCSSAWSQGGDGRDHVTSPSWRPARLPHRGLVATPARPGRARGRPEARTVQPDLPQARARARGPVRARARVRPAVPSSAERVRLNANRPNANQPSGNQPSGNEPRRRAEAVARLVRRSWSRSVADCARAGWVWPTLSAAPPAESAVQTVILLPICAATVSGCSWSAARSSSVRSSGSGYQAR